MNPNKYFSSGGQCSILALFIFPGKASQA